MSEKNLLSLFDQLSTEIVFEIFDYLSCNDIMSTFFNLNQRFNSIILQHIRFLNHFATPTNNISYWQTILPTISSQIKCLTITAPYFLFSLDLFPNLKSLIISSSLPIYYDEVSLILKSEQFKKLNSFKIKSEIVNRSDFHKVIFFDKVLVDANSLHIFESLPELRVPFSNVNNLKMRVNLQSLSVKLSYFQCLFSLLYYTPNLKYLNLRSSDLLRDGLVRRIDLSLIKLKKFSFVLQRNEVVDEKSFSFLTSFIKKFSSSLVYLSLNLDQINTKQLTFNGFTLQQQLLESMIQLKSFHLYTQLDKKPKDIERFLSTFQTQFWFDHHWTLGIYETYLFTLPFHFDKLKNLIDFDQIKSSNSVILNSPRTWSHVKSIDYFEYSNNTVNIIKEMKLKMPNLTSVIYNIQQMNSLYANTDETNQNVITLDTITTVYCGDPDLQTIKRWLIKIFPNTTHLILSYGAYSAALPSNRRVSSRGVTYPGYRRCGIYERIFLPAILHISRFYQHLWHPQFPGYATLLVSSQKRDEYSWGTDYIYFSKIQYVNIKLYFIDLDCTYENAIYLVEELLKMFRNLQSLVLDFHQMHEFPRIYPFTDLKKMIEVLNMKKISEKYKIKHSYNHLQFIRKNSE